MSESIPTSLGLGGRADVRRVMQDSMKWRDGESGFEIPPQLRQDPSIQTAVIVAAAQDLKLDALRKGMAEKYKDAQGIAAEATGPEDEATRLYVGGKTVRASRQDVGVIAAAEQELHRADEGARKAVAHAAGALGVKDELRINDIANALTAEARQNMQSGAAAAPFPTVPNKKGRGR